jgi:hypothetical protein
MRDWNQSPPLPPVHSTFFKEKGRAALHFSWMIKGVFGSHLRFCGLHLLVQTPAGQARSMQ